MDPGLQKTPLWFEKGDGEPGLLLPPAPSSLRIWKLGPGGAHSLDTRDHPDVPGVGVGSWEPTQYMAGRVKRGQVTHPEGRRERCGEPGGVHSEAPKCYFIRRWQPAERGVLGGWQKLQGGWHQT